MALTATKENTSSANKARHTILALVCSLVFSVSANAEQILRFGTGGSDGTYFPIGSLIADAINERCVDAEKQGQLIVLPQRSNGSVSNLVDLSKDLLEMALAQADVINSAYQGEGEFQDKAYRETLRTIGSLFLESVHLVVLK